MRILFVTDLYQIEEDRTIPNVILDFVLGFKKRGFEIGVIRPNYIPNTIFRNHKIFKEGIYYKNNIKIYNKNFLLPFIDDDCDYIEEKYDLIISHMPSGHIYSDLINKKLSLPHISVIHQSDYRVLTEKKYSFYFKKRLKNAINNSNLVGARNKFLREKLNADFILPSFIDENNIITFEKKIHKDKLKIISLSKLIKRKNIDLVIKALSKLEFNYEYSVYGEGIEKKKLEKLIKKYGLEDKIKIYPHINHNLVFEKLDENDVFILPSINETFGISYLEAMSRGLITIGIKNTGIDGVIQNNKNGYLINPKESDIISILNKIKNVDNNSVVQNTIDNIKNYSEDKIMNKYVDIIKKNL